MKITRYIWLLFVIALYALNYAWLKIGIWTYTGIVLGTLLVLVIAINIFVKIKNRKGKTDDDFIFPTKVANTMKAIDISTQYEASILSMFCLIIGMLLFLIYVIFIAPYNLILKIFIAFNSVCGIVLMASMLVTNYQQLMAHKESTKMLGDLANQFGTEILSPDMMKSGSILTPLETKQEMKQEIPDTILPKQEENNNYNPFINNSERRLE
jgi:uncharacterized membrane protein